MFGIDSILGLPLHILVVHFAVVMVPLAAIAFLALAWRAEWRQKYSLQLALLAIGGAAAAFVAAESGDALKHTIRSRALAAGTTANFRDHPGNGSNAEIAAILFAIAAIVSWLIVRWGEEKGLPAWTGGASFFASGVLALVAIAMIIIAGHSGSALVWKDLGNYVAR